MFIRRCFSNLARRVALHDHHVELGGKMVEFGGFQMPLKYEGFGELKEHNAVRKTAGVFDVSHMGEFKIYGSDAGEFLQRILTNNIKRIEVDMAQYNIMCHENGGCVDDLLVYRKSEQEYMMVVNAANIEKDWVHVHGARLGVISHGMAADLDVHIEDISDEIALLAVQGPNTFNALYEMFGQDFEKLKYYRFAQFGRGSLTGIKDNIIISRTGYTGEKNGVEIYCSVNDVVRIWEELMHWGVVPCGLAARDMLRLEAGFSLYGHELNDDISPLEAGLGWAVKMNIGQFIGRNALKDDGLKRKIVAIKMKDERAIPRQGYHVECLDTGKKIGEITSGTRSPGLDRGIGLALVKNEDRFVQTGSNIGIRIRKKLIVAEVVKLPFL